MELSCTEQMLLQAIKAALCGRQVDWKDESPQELDGLMRLALQHKLQPLALQAIYDCPAAKAWPKLEENRQRAKAQVMAQTAKTAEFRTLYQAFSDAGCPPLVVKGVLCRDLYPNGDQRQSGDEDLFAAQTKFSDCCTVLRACGFVPIGQKEETTADEISWHKPGSLLKIELHRNLFAQGTEAVKSLQGFFENAFDTQKTYALQDGTVVCSLSEHDHLLYLILHAYKHFIRSGFGLRQVCDIGLWAEKYAHDIDWQLLYRQCESVHALDFSAAIFQIAETDLSVELKLPELWHKVRTDRMPLLCDLLSAGVYGSAELSRAHSASVTQNAVSAHRGYGSGSVLQSVFPPRSALQKQYPILKKCRALLPLIWCRRLISYWKETKGSGKGTVLEPLKIAKERKKLLKYYKAL